MLIGHIDRADRHYVSGWAMDTNRPEAQIDVSFRVNGEEWGRSVAGNFRQDLLDSGRYGDGRHGFTYLVDKPMSILKSYDIEVVGIFDNYSSTLAKLTLAAISTDQAQKNPILVTASGRSGTTILMKRLLQSPDITVVDKYPYEVKILAYYAHAYDVMTSSVNYTSPPDLGDYFSKMTRIGQNPFNHYEYENIFSDPYALYDFFEKRLPRKLMESFKSIILDFYEYVENRAGSSSSKYFAEKVDLLHCTRSFTHAAFDQTKEIVLVRDPRDLFCSYRSFWQTPADEAVSALKSIADEMVRLHSSKDKNKMIFVKYEDLVLQTEKTLYNISQFLNLDQNLEADPKSDSKLFESHGTSENINASVNRWKKDLNAGEIEQFEFMFSEFLNVYNYNIS